VGLDWLYTWLNPRPTARRAWQVFCYSLAPNDGSIYRRKIEAEVEHFVDLSAVTDHGLAADRIYHDKVSARVRS
jgi:hypothetical protein